VSLHAIRDFRQILSRVLEKMWRRPMGFERGIILILLVDKEPARFSLMPMYLIHRAAWLFAGMFGQLLEQVGNISFMSYLCHPRDSQHHHLRALLAPGGEPGRTF